MDGTASFPAKALTAVILPFFKLMRLKNLPATLLLPEPNWTFNNLSFSEIIPVATEEDIIYCDPPYYGRYVDYFNGWTE